MKSMGVLFVVHDCLLRSRVALTNAIRCGRVKGHNKKNALYTHLEITT